MKMYLIYAWRTHSKACYTVSLRHQQRLVSEKNTFYSHYSAEVLSILQNNGVRVSCANCWPSFFGTLIEIYQDTSKCFSHTCTSCLSYTCMAHCQRTTLCQTMIRCANSKASFHDAFLIKQYTTSELHSWWFILEMVVLICKQWKATWKVHTFKRGQLGQSFNSSALWGLYAF